jgi:UDP-glucose 4-epimerase
VPAIPGGKFVVVGGASMLGAHIGEQLLAGDASEVILLDNLALGSTQNIAELLSDSRCKFVRGDMLRINELYDAFENAAGIFSVAGFLGGPMAANPWLGLDVNIRGIQNVMEAARYRGVKKVVFSSSVGVYGAIGEEPNSEDSPLRWGAMQPAAVLYCASKVLGEAIGQLYDQKYGVDFVGLRYTALYGEKQHKRAMDGTRTIEAYERIRAGLRPQIEGTGEQVQDYIYITDAARANLMAMESSASRVGINIGSGQDSSRNLITELLLKSCGSDLKPEYHSDPSRVSMPAELKQGYSIARAKALIGWEPLVSIEEGIDRLVKWLDKSGGASPTGG